MGNRFNTTTKLLAGSLLLLSPALVAAAGLGKLSVLSALGQPLKVEIDVVALQKGESDSLTARIASPDAFRQAGIEYGAVVPQIRAAVEHRNDGHAVITLKSQQPIDEPFVDVLVELNSASGRLVRQYTFLLDPVGYKGPEPIITAPTTVAKPEAAPAPAASAAPVNAPAPAQPVAAAPTPAPTPAAAAPTDATPAPAAKQGDDTYKVKQGDTLTEIAMAHKPQDVSLQQMLVALHRANEDAFIKKNMNLVRVGKILRIPDAASASQINQDEAVRVVNTQTREFIDYRAKLAEAVAATTPNNEAGQQQVSGRITTQMDGKPAAGAAPKDELRLSKAAEGKGASAAGTATADDAAAREKALHEANARVADLERNLNDLQKLLELKNQQLAALQKQAQPQAEAPAVPAPETAPAQAEAKTDTAPAAQASSSSTAAETPTETPAEAPAADQPAAAVEPSAEAATPVAQPEPKPEPAAKRASAPQPEPEPSFVDTLMEDPMLLAGGGGAVIAMLIGLLIYRRRRGASLDNSLIGVTTTDSSSVFGTTGGRNVDTGASSLQTDFSQSAIGSIDTEEVDPVAEADVYMAYGRDAQAEEILKEALQKDSSRQAVRLKLLEIYAARKDLKAFETTASEIYAATAGQGADWEKAVSLGRSIDPSNPMYGAPQAVAEPAPVASAPAVSEPAVPPVAPLLDLDLDGDAASKPATPDVPLDPGVSQALDLDLDLNLGGSTDDGAPTEEPADFSPSGTFIMDAATKQAVSELGEPGDKALDIDLSSPTLEPQDVRPRANALDLEFKLDEPKAEVPAVDLSGLSLDLQDGSGQAGDSNWQEVATKLDLAKAYEEMGDKDGARELLNEVLKEGDNAQQQQARTMLEAIR